MTQYNRSGARELTAYVATTGTVVLPVQGKGLTLQTGTTYYLPLGEEIAAMPGEVSLIGVHLKWGTAFVGTIAIETSNFCQRIGGSIAGSPDVTDWDATVGNWIQQNPATAYISVTSTDGSTGGATVTNATVTVAGGAAGGTLFDVGNLGAKRVRIKIVATTGDVVRASVNGKLGS